MNLTGQKFGWFTVISIQTKCSESDRYVRWKCECACGSIRYIATGDLRRTRNYTFSCGCSRQYNKPPTPLSTHGLSKTPEYQCWASLIQRCTNTRNPKYLDYGGRGIAVCERWRNSFEAFITDMGVRPSASYSLDRINNDSDYEPSNCRWATIIVQNNNQRNRHQYRTSSAIIS
jgi:hypothetical protein